tara:strand:- start:765 stop:1646 length:882 start_codon:yes stop_codon:yes gene_type:complete
MQKEKENIFGNYREFVDVAFPKEKLLIDPILSNFYRPFSLRLSWLLYRRGIKPNAVTIAQIFIGLIGCLMISSFFTKISFFIGLIFLHFAYLLDCIDGEIARATKTESLQGVFLDKFSHALLMPAIFMSVGFFYSKYSIDNQDFIILVSLLASYSTFNPVNRLVTTIVNQLINKKHFKQYKIGNYKQYRENNPKLNIFYKNKSKMISFLKSKVIINFSYNFFRHVTYLALITFNFILDLFGTPSEILVILWLMLGLALISKELLMLFIVLFTNRIELSFQKTLSNLADFEIKK